MRFSLLHITLLFCITGSVVAQSKINQFLKPSDSLNTSRRNTVVITEASLATTALIGLDQLWYADYQRSKFKTINDSGEWLQMDKVGHVFTSYQLGRLSSNTLSWAGVNRKQRLIYSTTIGLGFLTAVEVMDGFSAEWGFSWSDMAANTLGTGLFIGQELIWEEQRILLKYSFHQTRFAEQRPDKLGNGLAEELLKDYNGQTYWLSANMNSFLNTDYLPDWLNLAFGYGAEGMLTGEPNDPQFPNQSRTRQYYLSLDMDLSKIKTKSHLLKTIFDVLNVIKVPFPTLELNSKGRLKMHYIYY